MTLTEHLPALQIAIPLLAAPVAVLLGGRRSAWLLAVMVSAAGLATTLGLVSRVADEGVIAYYLGGWAAPWGIEYRIDAVNAFVLLVVSTINFVGVIYAGESARSEISERQRPLFYSAWLLCYTGLAGICITGDAFNVFVFLEISSLSTYLLVSLGTPGRALVASVRYLIIGTVGATFILIGIGLLYMMTGTLNMVDLAERLPEVNATHTVAAAVSFLGIGIAIKVALFPMHLWMPDAYTYSPSAVSALLAATATKVGIYLLYRFFYSVMGYDWTVASMGLAWTLIPLSAVAAVTGSLVAVFQSDIKRMLAYSSVAQIGYMTMGAGMANLDGLTASILHLFNHGIMKSALFMALGCVMYRTGAVTLSAMAGLGRLMPWTMGAFFIAALSLIGVPFTAGFLSKWYLILGAADHHWWWLIALIVISSLLAVVYIWRVVEAAWFREPEHTANVTEAPLSLLVPLWILALANILFGVSGDALVSFARDGATLLIGAGP